MEAKTLYTPYLITYSNYFIFEGKKYAFRRKLLFDISGVPKLINEVDNNGCLGYWINRKFISRSSIEKIIKIEDAFVDVSDLQWFKQIELDYIFNL